MLLFTTGSVVFRHIAHRGRVRRVPLRLLLFLLSPSSFLHTQPASDAGLLSILITRSRAQSLSTGSCKINVPLFENSRPSAARQLGQPICTANFGKFKLNSLYFSFTQPCTLALQVATCNVESPLLSVRPRLS